MPSALLLAHIEVWVAELERKVQAFEAAVDEVEEEMEKAEQDCARDETDAPGEKIEQHEQRARPMRRLQRLEQALAKAEHIAGLVNAANSTLNQAIDAAQQVVTNEQIGASSPPDPATPQIAPQQTIEEQAAAVDSLPADPADEARPTSLQGGGTAPQRLIRASLMYPHTAAQQLPREAMYEPLPHGATILAGRYRIVELLHARPRVNLYLAYRLASANERAQGTPSSSLVAIREIVLTGLSPELQKRIKQAAFEEFVAPGLLGSPRLPGVGDRISVEHERHYLIMQLRPAEERSTRQAKQAGQAAIAVPLAELLLKHQQWPEWLDMETAFEWGVQLCRIVARLHHMGVVLGDLDPATILVSSTGPATWAPVLLVSWPPAPQFWLAGSSREQHASIFPIADSLPENAFAAPETLLGRADERSDVYSLGAILYLFFTRYAPAAAALRQPVEQPAQNGHHHEEQSGTEPAPQAKPVPFRLSTSATLKSAKVRLTPFEPQSGMALVPPHLFNSLISPSLEALLMRALALSPSERFPSIFSLVEALEAIDPAIEFVDRFEETNPTHRDSRITRVLERVRRNNS